MPHVVRFKPGVVTSRLAPAGVRILAALDMTARRLAHDVTVTSGNEAHAPTDPHTLGAAFDIRTHDLEGDARKLVLLRAILLELQDDDQDAPLATSGGLATAHFWGWVEHPGQPTEHIHVQLRKNAVYP